MMIGCGTTGAAHHEPEHAGRESGVTPPAEPTGVALTPPPVDPDEDVATGATPPSPDLDENAANEAPRFVTRPRVLRGGLAGEGPPPGPTIPPGFVRVEELSKPPPLRGSVWRTRRDPERDALVCQRWRVLQDQHGVTLERRWRQRWGRRGLSEERERIPLRGGPVEFDMYSMEFERRWIRKPDPRDGMPGLAGATGCVTPITVVDVEDDRIVWVEAPRVIAYHPAEARIWYRTEAACQASLEDREPQVLARRRGGCVD